MVTHKVGDIIADTQIVSDGFIRRVGAKSKTMTAYTVKCTICNREKEMLGNNIRRGVGTTHQACGFGLKCKDERFYGIWTNMRQRTTNTNYVEYSRYGGRGISSDAYANFVDFYDDLYESYVLACTIYTDRYTSLDRVDGDGDYVRNNLAWVHLSSNCGKTSRSIKLRATHENGEVQAFDKIVDFARNNKINESTVRSAVRDNRVLSGWSFECERGVTTILKGSSLVV